MKGTEEGKFLAVRYGEIRSLLRNGCFQVLKAIPVLIPASENNIPNAWVPDLSVLQTG
jgi:hypothetical protein